MLLILLILEMDVILELMTATLDGATKDINIINPLTTGFSMEILHIIKYLLTVVWIFYY